MAREHGDAIFATLGRREPLRGVLGSDGMSRLVPSRSSRPADDPIFALNREATSRKSKGESIVNATVGALLDDAGKLAVLPATARAIREVPEGEWAAYAPIAGTPEFLKAVIDDLFSASPELRSAACGAATPGGTGALRHALANYLEPGQKMLTTSYYWGPYQTLADEGDRGIETFRMFDDAGGLDVDALDAAIEKQLAAQGRVLLFLNDPCHNPTGYSMSMPEWGKVATVLEKHGKNGPVTLLCDMAYFAYAETEPRAFMSHLVPLLGKIGLLFAWSASKSFTHYGLRVGALVACEPEAQERSRTEAALAYSCRGTWSNCNRGGLVAVTKLLTDPALRAACEAEREALKENLRQRVRSFNEKAKGKLVYPRYEGGFFVTVFADDAEARAARMREKGVFVVPGKGTLRVALCGVAERDVSRLVDALAD